MALTIFIKIAKFLSCRYERFYPYLYQFRVVSFNFRQHFEHAKCPSRYYLRRLEQEEANKGVLEESAIDNFNLLRNYGS